MVDASTTTREVSNESVMMKPLLLNNYMDAVDKDLECRVSEPYIRITRTLISKYKGQRLNPLNNNYSSLPNISKIISARTKPVNFLSKFSSPNNGRNTKEGTVTRNFRHKRNKEKGIKYKIMEAAYKYLNKVEDFFNSPKKSQTLVLPSIKLKPIPQRIMLKKQNYLGKIYAELMKEKKGQSEESHVKYDLNENSLRNSTHLFPRTLKSIIKQDLIG